MTEIVSEAGTVNDLGIKSAERRRLTRLRSGQMLRYASPNLSDLQAMS
jgi:hypothetical protein